MKTKILATLATALMFTGLTSPADARDPYRSSGYGYGSGYGGYGGYRPPTQVYTERYMIGRDHCGRPVWGYRTVRRPYCPQPVIVRPRYAAPCPPPPCRSERAYYDDRGYSSNRVIIQASFGR